MSPAAQDSKKTGNDHRKREKERCWRSKSKREKKNSKMLRGRAHVTAAHDSKDRERSLKREDNGYIPAVVDVVASIAVVGEASTEARIVGELPDRIGLFATDTGDPTGTELHRHASETFFSDPPADSVRSLQNHHVLYPVLCQHLCRRYSFQQKTKKKKTSKTKSAKVFVIDGGDAFGGFTRDTCTNNDYGGTRRGIHEWMEKMCIFVCLFEFIRKRQSERERERVCVGFVGERGRKSGRRPFYSCLWWFFNLFIIIFFYLREIYFKFSTFLHKVGVLVWELCFLFSVSASVSFSLNFYYLSFHLTWLDA